MGAIVAPDCTIHTIVQADIAAQGSVIAAPTHYVTVYMLVIMSACGDNDRPLIRHSCSVNSRLPTLIMHTANRHTAIV